MAWVGPPPTPLEAMAMGVGEVIEATTEAGVATMGTTAAGAAAEGGGGATGHMGAGAAVKTEGLAEAATGRR